MDKLLNFVAAIEEELDKRRVCVTPLPNQDYDYLLSVRQLYELDTGLTSAYNFEGLQEFRDEFETLEIRTGVNEDVADVGTGVNAASIADTDLGQHWVEFRVKE